MKGYHSLTQRLILLVSAAVCIIFTLLLLYNFSESRRVLLEDVKRDVDQEQILALEKIEQMTRIAEIGPLSMARLLNQNSTDSLTINIFIRNIIQSNPYIENAFVYINNPSFGPFADRTFYFKELDEGISLLDKSEIELFVNTNTPDTLKTPFLPKARWFGPLYIGSEQQPIMRYIVPVIDTFPNGTLYSPVLTGIDLSLSMLDSIINQKAYSAGSFFFIIDNNGQIVSWPNNSYTSAQNILNIAMHQNTSSFQAAMQRMMTTGGGFESEELTFDGEPVYMDYRAIPNTNASLGMIIPQEEVKRDLIKLTQELIFFAGFGSLLIILTISLILHRKMKSLRKLAESAYKIGEGDINTALPEVTSNDEIALLWSSLSSMQNELNSYIKKLITETAQREKVESQLQIAHDIQMGFLRNDFEAIEEACHNSISLYAMLKPAQAVGGDLYDFFMPDKNHLAFAIGDVSGKGIPAALFMSSVITLLHAQLTADRPVQDVAKAISNELQHNNNECYFVTLIVGIINIKTGKLTFTNAGHNYPYLLRNNEINELCANHGPAVGIIHEYNYSFGELDMELGDQLILFTDGVTEEMNEQEVLYGNRRLEQAIMRQPASSTSEQLVKNLMEDVVKFQDNAKQSDDITLLNIRYQSSV